jgi:deoxycytidine triphosphate deaminase
MPSFEELGIPVGFLTDRQIRLALENDALLLPNTWCENSIRHASYTLRLGPRVEIASAQKANVEDRRDLVNRDLGEGEYIDIHPGDTAKLFSIERLHLPDTVLAFTVARGLMYVEALMPENTYADPGFQGDLFTTVTNLSHRIVRLNYGDPIARLFFFRLAEPVQESWRPGISRGNRQRLDSFREYKLGTQAECRSANYHDLIDAVSCLPTGGTQLAELARRASLRWIGLVGFAFLWPILLTVANQNDWVKKSVNNLLAKVAALVLSAVISLLVPWLWQHIRKT